MTFVLAARCRDGIVVAGDTRVIEERDMTTEAVQNKVVAINEHSVVGFAGNRYLGQRFIERMKEAAEGENQTLPALVGKAEDVLHELWKKYAKARGENGSDGESQEESGLETIVVGLDASQGNKAQIYFVETNLMPDQVDRAQFLGGAGRTGEGALAVLWDENLTVEESWPLAVVTMKLVGSRHYSVGGIPDIYLLRDGSGHSKVSSDKVEHICKKAEEVLKGIPKYVCSQLLAV